MEVQLKIPYLAIMRRFPILESLQQLQIPDTVVTLVAACYDRRTYYAWLIATERRSARLYKEFFILTK